MDVPTTIDWVARLGPSGILAAGLIILYRRLIELERAYQALQEKRVLEAQANATALLAVADRTHISLERLDGMSEILEDLIRRYPQPPRR